MLNTETNYFLFIYDQDVNKLIQSASTDIEIEANSPIYKRLCSFVDLKRWHNEFTSLFLMHEEFGSRIMFDSNYSTNKKIISAIRNFNHRNPDNNKLLYWLDHDSFMKASEIRAQYRNEPNPIIEILNIICMQDFEMEHN